MVNGVRLFFDVSGEKLIPDGPRMRDLPTVLLLHGGPGVDHSMFKPDFTALAEIAQLVYLDHRGNGRSDHGDPALWTLDQWGDDVLAFCETLGIERPIVLGYSFGGCVAQSYATRHPEHPAKLILYSTTPVWDDAVILDAFRRIGGDEAHAVAARHFAGRTAETTAAFGRVCFPLYNVQPYRQDFWRRAIRNNDLPALFFDGEARSMDFRPRLGRIRCPTLIVAGERDPRCPPVFAQMIADAIGRDLARLVVFEGCGHGPHNEQPDRAMALLREFVGAD